MARLEQSFDFEDELQEAMTEVRQEFALRLALAANKVVDRTPVVSGRTRSNWFLTTAGRRFSRRNVNNREGDPSRANFLRTLTAWAKQRGNDNLVLYNNVEWIVGLENGRSLQAPQGMLAITVAEFEAGL